MNSNTNDWEILDHIDDGYLSPEEDGKIVNDNKPPKKELFLDYLECKTAPSDGCYWVCREELRSELETETDNTQDDFLTNIDENLVNSILEIGKLPIKTEEDLNTIKCETIDGETIDGEPIIIVEESSNIIHNKNPHTITETTKEIVKKIPESFWLNIALYILKSSSYNGHYDWRISLTCSIASSAILLIRNRTIAISLSRFTLFKGIPLIIEKTSSLKSYYFKKI